MRNEKTTTMRYGEYLRKSTDDDEKQLLSLERQRDVLDRLKNAHNLTIVTTVEEKKSAKYPGRQGFNSLLQQVKAGVINGIVTWAPHRLSRNAVDNGEIINLFDTGRLKEVVTENYVYKNNPMDVFMLGFQGLQAKFENDNKAIDVKNGMEKVASKGMFPGRPPLGYLPDKRGIKGARKRDPDPISFPIIRKMVDTFLAKTHTPIQIITMAIEQWGLRTVEGKKPSLSTVYRIFHNTFYYGEYEWPKGSGNVYKGNHKALMTKEEFIRIQLILRKPDNPRPAKHYFSYGGCTLRCGKCGCAMSGELKIKRQKNGNVHQYTYYKCTKRKGACSQLPIPESAIVRDIEHVLTIIQMPDSVHQYLIDWVRREEANMEKITNAPHEANKHALDQVQKKINGLINMRTSDLITDEEFRDQKAELDEEKNRLTLLMESNANKIETWIQIADEVFAFATSALRRFKNATPQERRTILLKLGSDLVINDKKLDLTRAGWIMPLSEIAKGMNDIIKEFGPISPLENKAQIEIWLSSPIVCSQLYDLRTSLVQAPKKS